MAQQQPALTIPGPVLVMGAGTVGCFLGGCLAVAGVPVTLIGRPRVLDAIAEHGLTISDVDGARRMLPATALTLATSVPINATPALVLLTVKSGATADAAAQLAAALPPGSCVVSMQNGMSNVAVAEVAAPELQVLPGVVPYNVAEVAPGAFHRGTTGRLAAQDHPALRDWVTVFERAGIPLDLHADLRPLQWGKLLLNLNNPVNALSGLPLRDELLQRGYRRCFAALIDEAIAALDAAGIVPARVAPLPARRMPTVLRLPDWLFRVIAARMLRIDAQARSSMADDLALGRRTEVDAFCGEVMRLAQAHGLAAPRNVRMVELLDGRWPEPPERLNAAGLCRALDL